MTSSARPPGCGSRVFNRRHRRTIPGMRPPGAGLRGVCAVPLRASLFVWDLKKEKKKKTTLRFRRQKPAPHLGPAGVSSPRERGGAVFAMAAGGGRGRGGTCFSADFRESLLLYQLSLFFSFEVK